MGKKFAPAYANIYMAEWERTVFPKCPKKTLIYLRYLDDIFGFWPHNQEDFNSFMETLNNHHESITLKYDINQEKITFLDTEVFFYIKDDTSLGLHTKVFFKSTDTHALLHKSSFHPKHIFRGIIKSQLVRFRRICSTSEHFEEATTILFQDLKHRGYSWSFLRSIKKEVLHSPGPTSKPQQTTTLAMTGRMKPIPFISTFSPAATALRRSIQAPYAHLQTHRREFRSCPLITAYRRNPNIKDILVRATLTSTPADPLQSFFLHKNVIYNAHTSSSFPLTQDFSLTTRNLVYAIVCQHCHLLYVGQTKNTLKERLKQHLAHISRGLNITYLYTH